MALQGATIRNPVTGERIEFRTAADERSLAFDYYLEPGGFGMGKFAHAHPNQEERIEVRDGRLGVRLDGDEWTATPGTSFAIPAGTAHTVWNDGATEMRATVEIRPGLEMAALFETMFGLARDGKTDRRGLPGPLQLAVITDEFGDEIRLAAIPGPVQVGAAAALAPVGRLAGYRARYPEYSVRVPAEA